jgi:hypothetical protein
MSLSYFERAIIAELHGIIGKRIREKDLLEWQTRKIAKQDGERVIHIPRLEVWVAIPDTIKVKSATFT